ncbi:MAG: hypothetical protein HY235_22395 [Acidobacteria bacterium]|nr:hypothetical protein [Acidobacteriota bacterium]
MVKARHAAVSWDPKKKRWLVRIEVGGEVIKRPAKVAPDAGDDALRSLAVVTAQEEGFELDPAGVAITR